MRKVGTSFIALGGFILIAVALIGAAFVYRQLLDTKNACIDLSQRVVVKEDVTPVMTATPSAKPSVTTTLKRATVIPSVAPTKVLGK